MCRLLPRSHGLPRFPGGSASASSLSRPAQASPALRPAGLLNRPRQPLSRGFDQAGCPARPLVSYRSNRRIGLVMFMLSILQGLAETDASHAAPHHVANRLWADIAMDIVLIVLIALIASVFVLGGNV